MYELVSIHERDALIGESLRGVQSIAVLLRILRNEFEDSL